VFSNLAAYITNVLWVFEAGRHRKHVEIGLFYIVSGFSLAVGAGIGWSLIRLGGISTSFSYAGTVAASILINYVCRKYIVFRG
jgi:putative flippase GtrA